MGKTISHYRILDKLGEGGMGVVYKAQDIKLERLVALKFLPSHLLCDDQAKTRLQHEAKAASALNHPNISTVYEIDETEGECFIAMEYVDGKSVKQLLKEKTFSLEEIVNLSVQIAEGLNAAHRKGIVHRDIKSDNLMLSQEGLLKIMDFGVAKLKGALGLTRTGSTSGTLAYMSPEQIEGTEADERSDIFSFGVVLYEMITGQLPFKGEHEAAIIYSILNEEPLPISSVRADTPPALQRIVRKALEKNSSKRYQSVQEIVSDLKKANTPEIQLLKQEKSIAVLPFEDLSPDKDQEYFSDGLTEEVISDLSNVHSLRVISRSSSMTFKGTKKKIPEIARELDVQYLLEGSVRKAGNSLRITAQLIDAASDAHLWAEKYSGTLDDVFAIQEKVSRSIVTALKLKLTPEESRKIAERPIDNFAAYECYLKANAEIMRFHEDSIARALAHLQKGVDILGDNALLYSGLAYAYWQYVNIGAAQEDYIAKAEEFAQKALALDPDSPQAHVVIAMLNMAFYGNVPEGIRQFKIALEANPNDLDALKLLPLFYIISVGKLPAALPLMQKFKQVDPLNNWVHGLEGTYHFFDSRYDLALEGNRIWYESEPDSTLAQFFYSWNLTYLKQFDQAFSIIDQSAKTTPDNVCTKFGLLLKYGLGKDKENALREMTLDFQKTCRRDHQWSYFVAVLLALNEIREESLNWLENAIDLGFINYPDLSRNPYLDRHRSDDRFKQLLERMKSEWENFEV